MFNLFTKNNERIDELEQVNQEIVTICVTQGKKIKALEEYLKVEYFNGPKYKPHYRKRKVTKGKVGRPRKNND